MFNACAIAAISAENGFCSALAPNVTESVFSFQTRAGVYMQIAVSSSARNKLVGFGVAIEKQPPRS
jgi:hypothetical protein